MTIEICHNKVDLELPHDAVKMLLYQPYIKFEEPIREPFRIASSKTKDHLLQIQAVISRAKSLNAHFVVLPEYSVPGLRGIQLLHDAICDKEFPANTSVIAGIDGLTNSEYADALSILDDCLNISPASYSDKVLSDQWVNCSLTWLKSRSGEVSAWPQPKIEAAWREVKTFHRQMFRGKSINLFEARFDNTVPCRFTSLICFDWIGRTGSTGQSVPDRFLYQLNSDWSGNQNRLHWLFLLQHNDKPNHYTFTTATRNFLTDRTSFPCVDCSHAALVFASTAASEKPIRVGSHGFTSIVFAPGVPFPASSICPPTITCKAKNLDATRDLGTCLDFVFREMGQCIQSCKLSVPSFVRPDPTDRKLAVSGEVFSLSPGTLDPRLPNAPVPAAVKWVNDQLDCCCSTSLAERYFSDSVFIEKVRKAEGDIAEQYRRLTGDRVEKAIYHSAIDCAENIDDWNEKEQRALSHIWDSLSLCASGLDLDTVAATYHAYCDSQNVDVLAIRGASHEECRNHYDRKCLQSHSAVLLISRDDDNSQASEAELTKFYEKARGAGVKAIDYQSLLQACREAGDEKKLVNVLVKMVKIDEPTFI